VGTIGSVIFPLAVTSHKGNPDGNSKVWNTVLNENNGMLLNQPSLVIFEV